MKQQASATSNPLLKVRNISDKEHIDFRGKTIYVGIDVHQKDYQVAKLYHGICLGNHRMSANADSLIKHLRSHYPGADFKCVYESCSWGFNLQRKLTVAGIECIVAHAADIATTDKERRRKTDRVDALKLAEGLANGSLKGIHVPQEEIQKERNLIRYRSRLVGDITKSKNRLKSLLKYQGLEIPAQYAKKNWSRNFLAWVEQQGTKDPLLGDTLLLMLEQMKLLRQLLLKTEKKLRVLRNGKYQRSAELATSVSGIGPTTAMLFLLEVGDVRRFKGFDSLNDYVGLCPDKDSSGEIDRDTGITVRRHKLLRSALIESAWMAIQKDPALMDTYQLLTKRMTGHQAIIRIARKLLRRLRAVLLTGIKYQKGVVA
jgi:transposase